jgi:predicted TPR repeat methyltransferase|eukprot:CAMPEP_0174288114 /NCGR_PEP_ID=MMETSP0809-20121228/19201_1 /TAXON_ID=73025 ORGANISM="Eutreptiella gymnastica-like, Strain CCMP1594" /NCGR_SAMPLE_ID=MMETSP0809 /ASSEMBLY_ACC=CAM_ASM_000658 /LENGTH=220 /DNA_ID=CAMNT_0015385081 /DNA_START=25 /DNA_END=687 /DNA_ORIENTATION=+
MTALGTGCDGWVSSDLHSASEAAGSPEELQQVYKQWSVTYEREMLANDLHSYKSVTHAALDALDGTTGDLRVMDAGCGTGLLGQFFKSQYASNGQSGTVRLTGVDLSPEMLEVAAQKKCYDELQVVNLQAALPFEAASFDLIISAGVFLPGHCGPEILPGLLALLKDHGTAVTTIRKSFYTELEGEFHKHLALSGCKLQGLTLMPYYGAIEAYVMILKKL